jgi:hypothetical protein
MNDRVLIAADSKQMRPFGEEPSYSECKITPLGDTTVFSAVGGVKAMQKKTGKIVYSAHELAKATFARFKELPNTDSRTLKMAKYWGQAMSDQMRAAIAKGGTVQPLSAEGNIMTGFFVSTPELTKSTHWPVYRIDIIATLPKAKGSLETIRYIVAPENIPVGSVVTVGPEYRALVGEFISEQTPRSVAAKNKMRTVLRSNPTIDQDAFSLESVIAAVEEWATDGHIGGQTDILELTHSGSDWLAVKDNCRKQ